MRILSIVLAFVLSTTAFGQTGHKIDIHIKGLKDTTLLLGYFLGDQTYVRDTAKVNSQGDLQFKGTKALPRGVYFLVAEKTPLFNFLISNHQQFSLDTDKEDYIKFMKVKGDEDNDLFFANMRFNAEMHQLADPYIKVIQDSTLKEDQKTKAREEFNKINEKVMAYQDELIKAHPDYLTAKMLKLTREVVVPDPPKKADGSIDSTFQLRYYRKHYFDNFDLSDDALTKLPRPVYTEKLYDYLDKLFLQTPDSLMAAINELVSRVQKNPEAYKFLVWNCVYHYQRPTIMGLDEVYVRLVDKYFISGAMDFWAPASIKQSLKDYADKLRISLIGKTGANLTMQDQTLQPRSLYDIKKKYTILYIFDPDCGHCREETPKLVKFYEKEKARFNIEVYAVSLDTSLQKMKNYMKEMKMTWITVNGPRSYVGPVSKHYYAETTPSLYVLDDKKKIIAKGIPAEQLENFFGNYEKYLQRKTAVKPKGT